MTPLEVDVKTVGTFPPGSLVRHTGVGCVGVVKRSVRGEDRRDYLRVGWGGTAIQTDEPPDVLELVQP